ncbi:FAD/NAD(P)-binding protein [Roseomonas sp. GC11]|uniref:FAD/NAD(P)-binding protein n=1 Tax=Roseomonas sp. GC11 TaxID=2950546 RepID=UPI00272ED0CF|nr:FAD/NAD(P)-binding protein [Roseomonas sp. GC11]
MTNERPAVAILGGGFAGVALALQLRGRATVHLYEPAAPGPGLAYATPHPSHLLNVPATGMSLYPDRPGHFAEWLAARGGAGPESGPVFAPRAVYGAYLREEWAAAVAADAGLRHVPRRVVALHPRPGGGHVLTDASGARAEADEVVLAVGGFAGGGGQPPHLWGDPWDPAARAGLPPEEPVLLVGLGLTMVDVLLALREGGHRGPVLAVSRHGWLPLAHVPGAFPAPWPVAVPEGEGVLPLWRRLRREAARAVAAGQPWQAVLDGVRPQVQRLWQGWDAAQRGRFLRHARSAWNLHRHRLAPGVAACLAAELAGGGLRTLAARLEDWSPRGAGVEAVLRRRHGGEARVMVSRIILCTGPEGGQSWREAEPLWSLLAEGRLVLDAQRLGVRTDAACRALDAAGRVVPGLSVLGPLTRGRLWEVTAVPEIRGQAAALADRLAGGKAGDSV